MKQPQYKNRNISPGCRILTGLICQYAYVFVNTEQILFKCTNLQSLKEMEEQRENMQIPEKPWHGTNQAIASKIKKKQAIFSSLAGQ